MHTDHTLTSHLATRRIATLVAAALTSVTVGAAVAAPAGAQSPLGSGSSDVASLISKAGQWISSGGGLWGDPKADKTATVDGKYSAAADPGSLYSVTNAIGARRVWAQSDPSGRPVTGQGVGVAVLDSGVSKVAALATPGKLSYGPDLSIEGNGVVKDVDTYGHGTHLSGIIGARGTSANSVSLAHQPAATQLGVAPDVQLEALKLATTDGSTDVSQVIAALDWVVQHPTTAAGTRIRVVNLSYGTDSVQGYQKDPLTAAVENAWRHGIVVVVSGGNEGQQAGRLTDPATDPFVISVGASDPEGTVTGWSQPSVAAFSSSGNSQRHVDLLAPGRSLVSMRAPGSFVDVNHPEGLVAGDGSGQLFRGSGTSQAASVISGTVALLLQAVPDLTPDQVKYVLTHSTRAVAADAVYAGAGQVDVAAALNLARLITTPVGAGQARAAVQRWPLSDGSGSLEQARGGNHLVDPDGDELSGEMDIQGSTWDAVAWWRSTTALRAWQGGTWNGAVWTGTSWVNDPSWNSARWSGARWSSARWSGDNWDSARWSSARWSSARWSSARWSSARWSGAMWN